ncbi:putative monooxygenase [Hortaea werneckii]|nr:putative monooxygenase [Hortaea werneckii]KAI6865306.1 putative monooxygenase [Hortaea werneckii]
MAPKAVKDLDIAIVGAGMGGLATALALAKQGFNNIHVYEYASNLGFVGAGIQLAPNMARVLDRLGCWADIEKEAVDLKDTSIRQGSTDNELGHVDLRYIRDTYLYPHMVGHRSSLAGSMYEACKKEKAITFHFATSAGDVQSWGERPRFEAIPREGEKYTVECDVLFACDGVKSTIRDQLLRLKSIDAKIIDTGQAAYRIMLRREDMQNDPELLELIDKESVTRWIGEKRHIIAYPVSSKQIYNLSTVQPDQNFASAPSATYTTKGSKPQMMEVFGDFCPKVRRMLDLVPDGEVCEWKLRVHEPLPFWVHEQTVLVGDACHPTLPHLAQGAAQAIEDGAVIAVALSKLPEVTPTAINKAMRVYEEVRKDRAYTLVNIAAASGRAMHLGEGKEKEERDKQFAALKDGKGPVPDKWADADIQKTIYGQDVMKITEEEFDKLYAKISTTSNGSTDSPPYKTYKLLSDHAPSRRDIKLQEDETSTTFFSIQAPRLPSDQRPEVHLRDATNSQTLATAQVRRSTSAREFAFRLSDTPHAYFAWTPVRAAARSFPEESCFEFRFSGCPYTWIRTHSADLGASRWTGRCYKLVQGSYDDLRHGDDDEIEPPAHRQVLMAYLHSPWFDRHAHCAGEIRVYGRDDREEEREECWERAGIITALGIQLREREMRGEALRGVGQTAG